MGMHLQVIGHVSSRFNYLAAAVEASARRLGLEYQMEKITDLSKFSDYGVVAPPALIVDGIMKISGRVPKEAELDRLLSSKGHG